MTIARIEPLKHGLMADFKHTEFPALVYGFEGQNELEIDEGAGTVFGYVASGLIFIITGEHDGLSVGAGCCFAVPTFGSRLIFRFMKRTRGFAVFRASYLGLRTVVGPLEDRGRLRYIDGCSDTLLIAPPLKGDPCFNLLHFPPGIKQTAHTHPSIRAGLIHQGRGRCVTAEGVEPLDTGSMFILAPDAIHAFETDDDEMTLTVFHPDSDFGPTHEEHPMLNRTIVEGVSAKHRPDLQTKEIR